MSRKSHKERIVRKSAARVKRSSPSELARLAARMNDPVDTSDIPERTAPCNRVVRTPDGRIVQPESSILRRAILAEVNRRGISGHELWKLARTHCDTLPESAVYEFLASKRQVGLAYLDAMLNAMELTVEPRA
jgi:hypothetical protein